MQLRDSTTRLSARRALSPGTVTATANGQSVDLQGNLGVTFILQSGTITDGTYVPKLQESDDGSTWTDVVAGDLIGSFAQWVATDDHKVQVVGYIGYKRYVRLVLTVTGATSGGVFSAAAIVWPDRIGTLLP